ncbi:MAG TPA: ATP-binding protein, partial [Polyangiales bacterium]|nr:ATP-binding protein [Polyangiales bacterium]
RDITERKQVEHALAQQREWFRVTLASIGDAVIATDKQGRIVFMNAVAEHMTGWTSAQAEGHDCDEVFHIVNETTRKPVVNPVTRVLREGTVVGLANHTVLIARNGSELPIDDSAAPIRMPDGSTTGVVLVFHDVSERRVAEHQRQQLAREREQLLQSERAARREAERANRSKDDFVATLSHELRTPLNAILGWTQVLRAGLGDAATVERGLNVIERNTRLQAQLISDLLDVSRIVSGKLRLEVQLVELAEVVEHATETVKPSADAKNVRIESQLEPGLPAIAGDPARLQQVVWNLLSNAVKFSPADSTVHVRLERDGVNGKITVSDSGAGIRADFLPYLFDRFRQADASTTRRFGGLGLGLTIVKQLVDLHGGHVSAQSEGEGRGATFSVTLPLEASRTGLHRMRTASVAPELDDRLHGLRVLLVEDEPDGRELVERLLSEVGCEVTAVESAQAAFATLDRERPDLLITDIGLPGEDGYSLIRRLRQHERTSGGALPAIALTAFARSEDRARALLAGFQAHVAKPVDPAELLTTVASFAGVLERSAQPSPDDVR